MIDSYKKGKHIYTHWDKKSEKVTVVPKNTKEPSSTITVEVPTYLINGFRANIFFISHNEDEFVIDFGFLPPNQNNARISTRVVLSPRQVKKILLTLEKKLNTCDTKSPDSHRG
ncbi:MAG: DUF3467 domain-containing protein [Elusimicrobia bacterium]|nr:DUF3467 domain-containing protein [Candidatus Liberimonas magnetica]